MRMLLVCLFLCCGFAPGQSQPAHPAASAGVAARRAQLLHRGVNASMWFAQADDYSPARLRSYTTADDIALMHSMGFDHVRLSIDGDELLRNAPAGGLNAVFLAELDTAVNTMLKDDLRVIVDVHPSDKFKRQLRTDDAAVARFCALWSALASHYAQTDPDRLFFEVLNEPEFDDAQQWAAVQTRTIAAIREAAPHHTIIATASHYSGLTDLLTLEPVARPQRDLHLPRLRALRLHPSGCDLDHGAGATAPPCPVSVIAGKYRAVRLAGTPAHRPALGQLLRPGSLGRCAYSFRVELRRQMGGAASCAGVLRRVRRIPRVRGSSDAGGVAARYSHGPRRPRHRVGGMGLSGQLRRCVQNEWQSRTNSGGHHCPRSATPVTRHPPHALLNPRTHAPIHI